MGLVGALGCGPDGADPVGLVGAGVRETGLEAERGDTAETGDTAGSGDSAGEAPSWDASPPVEVGSIVTFTAECALGVGARRLSWELLDPAAHDWVRNPDLTDAAVLVDWLPIECFPVLESPAHLRWLDDGDIEYSQIHRVSPAYLDGSWLGVVAVEEMTTSEECRAILEAHDAEAPVLRVTRIESAAP